MKKYLLLMLLIGQLAFETKISSQNIGINGTGSLPDTSAMLDVSSTIKGFLAPRMTTTQRNAIPLPANGLMVYNTTDNLFNVNTGTVIAPVWVSLSAASGGTWFNAATNTAANSNTQNIYQSGNVGIGLNNPGAQLVVNNNIEIRRPVASGTVAQLLFTNTAGSGDFRLGGDGGDVYWQGGGGRSLQMGSYWTTILGGDRQTSVFPAFANGITGTSILVAAQRDASVALGIQANSATQAANLTEWRNADATVLSVMDKSGNLGLGIATPTQKLHVNGQAIISTLNSGAATDSIVTVDATGLLKKRTVSSIISGASLTSLNGATATTQAFAAGSAGTDFGISTAGSVHTFNLPTASAGSRGALSAADWASFNNKQAAFNGTGYAKFTALNAVPAYISAIPNSDLANSSMTIQGTSTPLGGTVNIINGTGFVKGSGTTISYDNSTYLTTTTAAATYLTTASAAATYNTILPVSNTVKKYLNGYKQFGSLITDSVTEGSNSLYYTNARAQAAITGTNNRTTVSAGAVDISASYPGQSSITTTGALSGGSLAAGFTTVPATVGGTGQTNVASGDLLYGSGLNTWGRIGAGTNGNVLTLAGGLPSWVAGGWSLAGNTVTAGSQFLGSTNSVSLRIRTNNTERMIIDSTGNVGIGVTAPTAVLHLEGGTATAKSAPLKFNQGTNLTTPEAGAVEFDGSNYYATSGTTRYTLAKTLTNTATLDFPSTTAFNSSELTFTLNGAAVGDAIVLGIPGTAFANKSVCVAYVSALNTVTVRYINYTGSTLDPATGVFRATIIKY